MVPNVRGAWVSGAADSTVLVVAWMSTTRPSPYGPGQDRDRTGTSADAQGDHDDCGGALADVSVSTV
jgi:hypothetical protein